LRADVLEFTPVCVLVNGNELLAVWEVRDNVLEVMLGSLLLTDVTLS